MRASADARLAPAWPCPDLRVVPLESIWSHEHIDQSRSGALQNAIRQQGMLENPVVVSAIPAAAPGPHRFIQL
jgi:hypothetical protein